MGGWPRKTSSGTQGDRWLIIRRWPRLRRHLVAGGEWNRGDVVRRSWYDVTGTEKNNNRGSSRASTTAAGSVAIVQKGRNDARNNMVVMDNNERVLSMSFLRSYNEQCTFCWPCFTGVRDPRTLRSGHAGKWPTPHYWFCVGGGDPNRIRGDLTHV